MDVEEMEGTDSFSRVEGFRCESVGFRDLNQKKLSQRAVDRI